MKWIIRHKIWLFFLIGLICTAITVCLILFWEITRRPIYLDLAIPSPNSHLPHGGWSNTQYITQVWEDNRARYFIVRQETIAYSSSHDPNNGFGNWGDIVTYFDKYLTSSGWQQETAQGYTPCVNFLPETNFLHAGENGYLAYVRTEFIEADKWTQPVVCLAVWPQSEDDEEVNSYHVVLISANPSWWSRWLSEF